MMESAIIFERLCIQFENITHQLNEYIRPTNISNEMKCSNMTNLKSQRKTNNLGFNTANTQNESYAEIEEKHPMRKKQA